MGVFAAGLDTVTSITVDASDNVWVAISGNTFGFPPEGIDKPHVKIFDKSGKLIRDEVGLGMFKSFALNEIAFCEENGRTYVGDYIIRYLGDRRRPGHAEADYERGPDRRPRARRHHLP